MLISRFELFPQLLPAFLATAIVVALIAERPTGKFEYRGSRTAMRLVENAVLQGECAAAALSRLSSLDRNSVLLNETVQIKRSAIRPVVGLRAIRLRLG